MSNVDVNDLFSDGEHLLALDISLESTGIAIVTNGQIEAANLSLRVPEGDMAAARSRLLLKKELTEEFAGQFFHTIIVEDVFAGKNVETYRLLVNLNQVIDELILEGIIECPNLVRMQNGVWKHWIRPLLKSSQFRLTDKVMAYTALLNLGIMQLGEGYQDRTDALAMLVGWKLTGEKTWGAEKKVRSVTWSNVRYAYCETREETLAAIPTGYSQEKRGGANLTKRDITATLRKGEPTVAYVDSRPRSMGVLGVDLKTPIFPGGGYFAFWLKEPKK